MPAQAGWVRAGPGRGCAGHRGPGGRGCSVTCDAREPRSELLAKRAAHRNMYEWTKPLRALVSPCVQWVKPRAAELPGVVSKDTDDAKLSGRHQAK